MPQPSSPTIRLYGWIRSPWCWLILGLCVIYIRGLFIDLMDVDAAQYASIAMEMLQHGHWLQLHYRHLDYLDKPPLLFWSSAASFALFGLHNWSYKLPSLLAGIAGVYATWRFALLYYSRATARNAAFILASCVGAALMTNDVRTDAMLTGLAMCATWQAAEYLASQRLRSLMLAGLFAGLAMLAKGPIGLVVPAFAVATHLVLRRDWRALLSPRWLAGLGVTAIVLLPMCWGLYQQFDLHPELAVNGRTGVSGLRFYFWEQSFGRITGGSPWRNDTTLLTFFHVYLWVFLPWTLLFVGALWHRVRDLVRHGFRIAAIDEGFSIGGFALTFVALSLSHYRLPHYIFVTLPAAAILTARWLAIPGAIGRAWWWAQYLVLAFFGALAIWLLVGVFPPGAPLVWLIVVLLSGCLVVACWRDPFPDRIDLLVQRSVLAAVTTLLVVNFHFYPNLLPFQSTIAVARFAARTGIPADKLVTFDRLAPATDFYARRIVPNVTSPDSLRQAVARDGAIWAFTDSTGRARIDSAGVHYSAAATFEHFEVAQLTRTFLDHRTRSATLGRTFLLRIAGSP